MALGFTDPGGSRPTPNRPTSVYQSKKPSFSGFQDPGLSAGQFGFGSSDRNRNDGPNIVLKSKPNVPQMSTYDAGKKAYADFLRSRTGQSGGISTIPTQSRVQYYQQQDPYGAANIRQQYFDNRPIPTERLQRRGMEDQLLDQFKAQYTYQQPGTNLYQMKANAPMSLSDYTMQLGRELGPTPKELMGDAGYALSSIGKGLAEKGTPMMNLAKSLFGGVQNFFGNQIDKAQGFFANQMASQNQFNQQLSSLTPQQRMVYDQLIFQPGMTRENAYAQAVGQGFAMGGIAKLN
jgi:hypothetical protein